MVPKIITKANNSERSCEGLAVPLHHGCFQGLLHVSSECFESNPSKESNQDLA